MCSLDEKTQAGMALHPTGQWRCIQEIPEAVELFLKGEAGQRAIAAGQEIAKRCINRAYFFGSGTSHFAATAGAYAMIELAGIDADYYEAFELLKYRMGGPMDHIAAVGCSHSGGTAVTVEAQALARKSGALSIAMTDIVDSPLAKYGEFVIDSGSGNEPVGAKTRSFVTTVVQEYLMAAAVRDDKAAIEELNRLPGLLKDALALEEQCKELAVKHAHCKNIFIVGGGPAWVNAQELALKFKECAPGHAEGMEVEDALHGPLAMLQPGVLVVGISTPGPSYDKVADVMKVAAACGCSVVSISDVPHRIENVDNIKAPFRGIRELFAVPLLAVPMYMFMYFSVLARGSNPDAYRKEDEAYRKARASIAPVHYSLN